MDMSIDSGSDVENCDTTSDNKNLQSKPIKTKKIEVVSIE